MAQGQRNDPYGRFNFLVEIDGVTVAGFSEASGLTTDSNVMEYRNGDENNHGVSTVRKLPGLVKFNNIVLKRGVTADQSLWNWRPRPCCRVPDAAAERQHQLCSMRAATRCSAGASTSLRLAVQIRRLRRSKERPAKLPSRHWRFATRACSSPAERRAVIPTYLTPGIYRTVPAAQPRSLTLVRTDIAGFAGYAERGPLPEDFEPGFDATLVARRLTSWAEYTATFGSFLPNGFLPFAVRGFFETGGDTCYVVRVAATRASADRQPVAASLPLPAGPAQPVGTLAQSGGGASVRITLAAGVTAQQLVGAGIAVQHTGLGQSASILALLADGSFLLSAPLDARFAAGDGVTWFPTAATIAARTRGAWGNRIRLDFVALDAGAFGLTVTVDLGPGTPPTEQEVYRRLTPATAAVVLAEQSNRGHLRSARDLRGPFRSTRPARLPGARSTSAAAAMG